MKLFETIGYHLKSKLDLVDNEKLKKNVLNALPFWVGAFVAGAVAALYAKLFSWVEQGTRWIYHESSGLFLILSPCCFLVAWWLVSKYAPFSRGSGIPQVSAAIELSNQHYQHPISKLLSWRIAFVKILSSLIFVFGGGVIGREGPTIQISSSIFKKINDMLPAWYPKVSKRNMIVTGAAAGLAAAFNTPLGGIVFAIEELTKTHFSFFKSALLTGVIIAGLTALNFFGPYLYLGHPFLEGINPWITLNIIPLALITGIVGSLAAEAILYLIRKKDALSKTYKKAIYVSLCGLLVAVLAVFVNFDTFGSGKEIMVSTLFTSDKHLEWYVPFLRIIGSIASFSTGAAGGIFAPSLSAGASIGAVFAESFHFSEAETNLLILCGMTGLLTSITRSPFTSSILVLEMTTGHSVIFFIMMTALLSNMAATSISRHSLYDKLRDIYLAEIHPTQTEVSAKA